mmetsp:Transcript_7655/g.8350  ORF Transcript_7655/g.8350 Transcript_7655/m.8350 type:complete len:221 (+) Transcript_7655:630-1292(+)
MGLLGVFPSVFLGLLDDSLSSQSELSDQSLDLGGLVGSLLAFLDDFSTDNIFTRIVLLLQTEELSDLVGSLGTQLVRSGSVSQTNNFVITLLDDLQGENTDIGANNATSDGLSLSLTSSSGSVVGHTLLQEKSDSSLNQDTLLHGETLLVVATGDSEDISLEFVTEEVTFDFGTHLSVHKNVQLLVIIDFEFLLLTRLRVRDIEFHICQEKIATQEFSMP